jgi:phosphate transport system substrate-binding protein
MAVADVRGPCAREPAGMPAWRLRAALVCLAAIAAACTPDVSPPAAATACAPPPARPDGLIAAGSGSNVAVVRELARRYRASGAARLRVADSIGTGGALRALGDRAIDVGLASRPLTEAERRAGLVETVLARVPVAFVANPGVTVAGVTRDELAAIFRGARDRWPDGTPIVPLLREPGDSGNDVVARAWPDVWAAMDAAMRESRFTTCYTDQEMADAVAGTEGALGVLDIGTLRLMHPSLRPLAVDGVPPTPHETAEGSHPLAKVLTFVTLGPPTGDAERFIRWAISSETAEHLAAWGYLPPVSR